MGLLLIDPQFGELSLGAVAAKLDRDAVVWPLSTARSIIASRQALQVLDEIQRSRESWPVAVGLRFGCAVATELVRQGRVEKAILIDPPSLLTASMELVQTASADVPVARTQAAERLQQELLPGMDPSGPYPLAFFHTYAIQITDSPTLQDQYSTVWSEAEQQRQPYDLQLSRRVSPEDAARLNWLAGFSDPAFDIQVWLPTERDSFREALLEMAPGRPLVQMAWGPLAWLSNPESVAADIRTVV